MSTFELPPLIAIGGGNGSGKSTLGYERELRTGVRSLDASEPLRNEAIARKLDPEMRGVLGPIAKEWAEKYNDPAIMAKKVLDIIGYEAASVMSVRRVAEAEFIRSLGGAIIWVDAPVELRHERAMKRARGTSDFKKLDEFIAEENKEMFTNDPSNLFNMHMDAIRQMADFTFENIAPEEEAPEVIAHTFNLPPRIK